MMILADEPMLLAAACSAGVDLRLLEGRTAMMSSSFMKIFHIKTEHAELCLRNGSFLVSCLETSKLGTAKELSAVVIIIEQVSITDVVHVLTHTTLLMSHGTLGSIASDTRLLVIVTSNLTTTNIFV